MQYPARAQGVPVKRYGPQEEPNSMIKEIEKLLKVLPISSFKDMSSLSSANVLVV
jgi:hypothetical protein